MTGSLSVAGWSTRTGHDVSDRAAAILAGTTREASRAAKLLDLGEWSYLAIEAGTMQRLPVNPTADTSLLAAMEAGRPAGQLTFIAERAAKAARLWLERGSMTRYCSPCSKPLIRLRGIRGAMVVSASDGLVVAESLMGGVKGTALAALAANLAEPRDAILPEGPAWALPRFLHLQADATGSCCWRPRAADLVLVAVASRRRPVGLAPARNAPHRGATAPDADDRAVGLGPLRDVRGRSPPDSRC